MNIYYNDHVKVELPAGHRFPMAKYGLLHRALLEEGVVRPGRLIPSPALDSHQLQVAHDPEYVESFLAGTLDRSAMRRIGLPWSEAFVERVRTSMGGTLMAAYAALEVGIGGNLAGGTHHAHRAMGGGFCVFNDLAIAALTLIEERRVRRVAIVDLDVHQGDGSATILANTPEVFTLSVHCEKNYPFRKPPSDLDVPLPQGCDDATYLEALERALEVVWRHRPELVLFQAGVDPLAEDSLGRMNLTLAGLHERDHRVLSQAHARGVPVAMTLGGGYARPIDPSVEAYLQTYRLARRIFGT